MIKKVIFLTLVVIIAVTLLLSGCKKQEATTTPPPQTTPTKTSTPSSTVTTTPAPTDARLPNLGSLAKPAGGIEGGVLQLVGSGNIANMGDPDAISNPGDAAYAFPALEPLVTIDSKGNLVPWLASSFTIADDGSYVTFKLRQGINFTDGTPFNADAVVYNLNDQIASTVWPNLKACSSCDKVDDYTVKLNFAGGQFNWYPLKSLAGFFSDMMFSPAYLKNNDSTYKRTHVIGTGPFVLSEFNRDQNIKYLRNDNYWRGKPYLSEVIFNIIPDTTAQLLAFKSGQVDTIGVQPKDAQGLIDAGFSIVKSFDMCINLCFIPSSNNPDSPLSNLKVRQAVEYAIDKDKLVAGLTYGYGKATNQEFVDVTGQYNPAVVGYPYDVQKAKDMLAAAGYPNLHTQIVMADIAPEDLPLAIQDMVKAAGITMDIKKVSIVQLNDMIAKGGPGWEGWFYSYGFPGVTVDPASVLGNGPLNGNTTWISCNEPQELLDLAAKASAERDQDKRNQDYQQIDKLMTDTYAQWLWLYYTPTLMSLAPRVLGVTVGKYSEFWPYTFSYIKK